MFIFGTCRHIYMHIGIYMYIYLYVHVCMYVPYICVYRYTQMLYIHTQEKKRGRGWLSYVQET